jgi:hypothetical protein
LSRGVAESSRHHACNPRPHAVSFRHRAPTHLLGTHPCVRSGVRALPSKRDLLSGPSGTDHVATGDPFGSDPLCSYVPPAPVDGRAWAPN